jgi:hypothetical protein
MAGHGSPPADNKADDPKRKVGRETMAQADVDKLSDADWLSYNMRRFGPGPEGSR